MDKAEAQSLIDREVDALRALSYAELCGRIPAKRQGFHFTDILDAIQAVTREVTAESGSVYLVETMVMWDGKAEEAIRVVVAVDDAGRTGFVSITDSFIVARDA